MGAELSGRRRVFVDDLVTATEISKKFGISTAMWINWVTRSTYDIPDPVAVLTDRGIRIWLASEIDAWAEQRRGMAPWLPVPVLIDNAVVGPPPESPDDLLTGAIVSALVGWTNPGTPWQQHLKGTFPAPFVTSGRTKLWRRGDVQEWKDQHPVGPSGRRAGRQSRRGGDTAQ